MLMVICAQFFLQALYAECHYAECRYADCRGASFLLVGIKLGTFCWWNYDDNHIVG
jgi:hypothetical protein